MLDTQEMEKGGAVPVGIHPDLLQTRANLLGNRVGCIGFDNHAIAAQQVENEQVRDRRAVRKTPALDPGYPSVGELPAEFGEQARLSDAGLADDADRLAATAFDLAKEIVQDGKLAFAVDESGPVRRLRLAQ